MSYMSPALFQAPILQNEGPSEYVVTGCLLDKYVSSPAFPCQPAPLSHLQLTLPCPFFSPSSSGGGGNRSKKPWFTLHGTKKTWNLAACGEAQPENEGQMACVREKKRIPGELPERRLGITSGRLKRLPGK